MAGEGSPSTPSSTSSSFYSRDDDSGGGSSDGSDAVRPPAGGGDTSTGEEESVEEPVHPELLSVTLDLGGRPLILKLTDNMTAQDVVDIIADMFGIVNFGIELESDSVTLEPYRRLKTLATGRQLHLKVLIDDFMVGRTREEPKTKENISIQTKPNKQMTSRITQTPCFPLVDSATNTPHSKLVQVDHIFSPKDKVISANKYIMYDELIKSQNEQAIMIQKSIRRFLAQKRIVQMKKERDLMIIQSQIKNKEVTHEKLQEEIKIILEKHPIPSQDDFSKAFSALADWLKKEKVKFKGKRGSEKKAAMNELFKKEMQTLNYINQLRMSHRNQREQNIKTTLVKRASKPVIKKYQAGNKTTIESDKTELAKIFNEMMNNLKRKGVSKDDRINTLQQLREFLQSMHVPECTNEMISLVEKEHQMILLGVKSNYLEGSRKRLLELFLYFSTDPEFNPGIQSVVKSKKTSPLIQCRICKELKPAADFNVDILSGLTDCSLCTARRELAKSNTGLVVYKGLGKEVVRSEERLGSGAGFAALLQPADIYYLVHGIWEGRSTLSEATDVKLLRLPRWEQAEPWAPWNSILLTAKEEELHLSILDKGAFYGQHFIKKIQNKHLQAKIKFKNLETLYERMKSGEESTEDTNSVDAEIECPLLNEMKSKKLNTKFNITEPISDLIFP